MKRWPIPALVVAAALAWAAGPRPLACSAAPAAAPKPAPKDACATCHAKSDAAQLKLPAQLVKPGGDVHAKAGIGCSSCHGGDGASDVAAVAHGKGFIARPSSAEAVSGVCGKCHEAPLQNFRKGPHHLGDKAARRPSCVTCHGAHGVKAASVDLIGEPLCSSCHSIGQARRIGKALGDAEDAIQLLDKDLGKTGNNVAERAKLREARARLRGVTHSLDLGVITRNAADALAVSDQVRAKVFPRKVARDWGDSIQSAAMGMAALLLLLGAIGGVRWAWARRRHLPVVGKLSRTAWKAILITGGVLSIAGAAVAYKGYLYMEHDPKFCLSCHTMQSAFDLWQKSGHKNIECHACHVPNIAANLHQLYEYATQRPDTVIKHASIDRHICETCHASGTASNKWNRVVETAGHKIHTGKQRIECVQCHGDSVHRFKPPKEMCAKCHKQITLTAAGTMAEMHCLQCHNFLAPAPAEGKKVSLKPDRVLCLDCHQQRQVKHEVFPTSKAPMQWDCGRCHRPHVKMAIGNTDCVKCHDTITEGLHRVKAHAEQCGSCHKPHLWTAGASACTGCHKTIDRAFHHPGKKTCVECHGAWDDTWAGPPIKGVKTAKK